MSTFAEAQRQANLPSFISNADFRPPPLADGYRESLEAVNKMSLHTCSVSKKNRTATFDMTSFHQFATFANYFRRQSHYSIFS